MELTLGATFSRRITLTTNFVHSRLWVGRLMVSNAGITASVVTSNIDVYPLYAPGATRLVNQVFT